MTRTSPEQWTEAEMRRLKAFARRKVSADDIARALGRHIGSVKRKARELGLLLFKKAKSKGRVTPQKTNNRWTAEENERLLALVDAEATWPLIAMNLKRSIQSVQERAQKLKANT